MKLYSQADFEQNRAQKKRETKRVLLCALPFLALAIAGFCLRAEALCIAGCVLCGASVILLYDLRVSPAIRYGRFLREAHSGLTRRTLGTLVRVSGDLTYEGGVYFREVILNTYEDMSEEGERRFLLDSAREIPTAWIGQDVIFTHHGSYVLEAEPAMQKQNGAEEGEA